MKNILNVSTSLAVAGLFCLLTIYPSGSEACGWWGDAEHDDKSGEERVDTEDVPMGSPEIQTRIGNRFRIGDNVKIDYTKAMLWYRKAAQQGFAGAQNNLGVMYEQGLGVPQNKFEAANWYRRAAEQGNPYAQHSLGSMYRDGHGVARDPAEAVQWIRKAAEQGHQSAFRDMGEMYWKGLGVSQNNVQAYMWWKLGAMRGDKESDMMLRMAADRMTPAAVAEAEMRAKKWRLKK